MASNYYTPSDSTDKPEYTLPPIHLHHTAPNGREFSYTVVRLTLQCYLMEADHTGATRQFPTAASLHRFWMALKRHLNTVHAMKLLPAPKPNTDDDPTPTTPAALPLVTLIEDAEYSHPIMAVAQPEVMRAEEVRETVKALANTFNMTRREDIPVAQETIDEITARRADITESKRMQAQMMADEPSAQTPNQAWQAKMDAWLAAHPLADRKPAQPVTTRFAKAAGF